MDGEQSCGVGDGGLLLHAADTHSNLPLPLKLGDSSATSMAPKTLRSPLLKEGGILLPTLMKEQPPKSKMGHHKDQYIDEGGEALMDSYGVHSDRQPSHYRRNQFDIEGGDEWHTEPTPTPEPFENKVGKPRKRLVKKSAAESGNPTKQAFGGDELDDWKEEDPVKKKRSFLGKKEEELCVKKRMKVLPKESQFDAKASSSRSKGYEDERIPQTTTIPKRPASKPPEKESIDDDIDEFLRRKKLHQASLRERASLPEPLPLDFVVRPPSNVNWEEVRARAIRAAMRAKKDKMRRKRRRPVAPLVAQKRRPLFKVQSSAY